MNSDVKILQNIADTLKENCLMRDAAGLMLRFFQVICFFRLMKCLQIFLKNCER